MVPAYWRLGSSGSNYTIKNNRNHPPSPISPKKLEVCVGIARRFFHLDLLDTHGPNPLLSLGLQPEHLHVHVLGVAVRQSEILLRFFETLVAVVVGLLTGEVSHSFNLDCRVLLPEHSTLPPWGFRAFLSEEGSLALGLVFVVEIPNIFVH